MNILFLLPGCSLLSQGDRISLGCGTVTVPMSPPAQCAGHGCQAAVWSSPGVVDGRENLGWFWGLGGQDWAAVAPHTGMGQRQLWGAAVPVTAPSPFQQDHVC